MPFKKGQSGNPAGRAKKDFKLSELASQYGPEVVAFMVKVMRGEHVPRKVRKGGTGKFMTIFDAPSFNDRIRAGEWLADRGYGRAPTVIAGKDGLTPSGIMVTWLPAQTPTLTIPTP